MLKDRTDVSMYASRALGLLMRWENFRRAYIWMMTENMKNILRHHEDVLCALDCNHITKANNSSSCNKQSAGVDIQQTLASTSLVGFDEYFTR